MPPQTCQIKFATTRGSSFSRQRYVFESNRVCAFVLPPVTLNSKIPVGWYTRAQ